MQREYNVDIRIFEHFTFLKFVYSTSFAQCLLLTLTKTAATVRILKMEKLNFSINNYTHLHHNSRWQENGFNEFNYMNTVYNLSSKCNQMFEKAHSHRAMTRRFYLESIIISISISNAINSHQSDDIRSLNSTDPLKDFNQSIVIFHRTNKRITFLGGLRISSALTFNS